MGIRVSKSASKKNGTLKDLVDANSTLLYLGHSRLASWTSREDTCFLHENRAGGAARCVQTLDQLCFFVLFLWCGGV